MTIGRILDRIRRYPAEIAWVVLGQVVAAVCALAGMRFLTRLLSPAEYGVLALALTVGALMQQLVFGPVSNAVLRFYSASAARGSLRMMLRAATALYGRATIALFFLTAAGLVVRAMRYGWAGSGVIGVAAIFAVVLGVNGALAAAHSAARRRSVVAGHQALGELLRFSVAVLVIRIVGSSGLAALVGFVIGIAACALSQGILLRRVVERSTGVAETPGEERTLSDAEWRRQLTQYAKPFAVWGIFTWAVLSADRWSLQLFQSTADVGRYAALFQLGSYPVTMGASMLVQLAAPVLFSRASDGSDPHRRQDSRRLNFLLTSLVLAATAIATLAALLLHRQIFRLLVGEAYRSVSWLLPAVVLGAGLFAAGQQLALTLQSDLQVKRLLGPKIGSAIAGVAFYFVGSRWWGMPGVVAAGVLFAAVHLLWIAHASRTASTAPPPAPAIPDAPPVPTA
ncbi:MAG: hypothetical protein JWM95_4122 [Gemmatimonadetes bacterium]|nr:hypothetical protein [Gemmatimonadota bacterium]